MDTKEIRSMLMRELFYAKSPLSLLEIHNRFHYPAGSLVNETIYLQGRGYVTYDESNFIIQLTPKGYITAEESLRFEYKICKHQDVYFEQKKSKKTIGIFEPYLPPLNTLNKLMGYEDIANRNRSESLRSS